MNSRRRMLLYRTMHSWHWISAAICLAGLLLFCITGITLNHATAIAANPQVTKKSAPLPDSLHPLLVSGKTGDALPDALADWIEDEFDIDTEGADVEWSPEELYLYPLYVRPLTGLGRRATGPDPAWDEQRLRLYR